MVSPDQKRKIGSIGMVLGGGVLAIFFWLVAGIHAIIYILIGVLIMGAGYMSWNREYKYAPYIWFVAGLLVLVASIGRALEYTPTDGLAIVLFILGIILFYRGYQYRQINNPN